MGVTWCESLSTGGGLMTWLHVQPTGVLSWASDPVSLVPAMARRNWNFSVGLLGLAALHFLATTIGLYLTSPYPSAPYLCLAAGVIVASAILWGTRVWPAILVGSFIAHATNGAPISHALV